MTIGNQFFLIFLSTILITRLFLYFRPIPALTIKGFRTHHWMYGLIGVPIALISHSLIIYAVSWGLFVDELTYIIIQGKDHKDNYSKVSLVGTLVFIVIVFFLKEYLMSFL